MFLNYNMIYAHNELRCKNENLFQIFGNFMFVSAIKLSKKVKTKENIALFLQGDG